ncbi:hypothetical protein CsSME_00022579 [Camellia sinensis var. sinensis]
MTVPSQQATKISSTKTTRRRRTKRSKRHPRATNLAVFFIWVILIFTQLCLSSSSEHNGHSSPRKVRFFSTVNSSVGSNFDDDDDDEDKRVVHTGPNPLHN